MAIGMEENGGLHAVKPKPHATGRIELVNGTNDGGPAFVDPFTGTTNLNAKIVLPLDLYDIREQPHQPKLTFEGFQLVEQPTMLTEDQFMRFQTPGGKQFLQDAYRPELRRLVEQTLTDAGKVFPWHLIFD